MAKRALDEAQALGRDLPEVQTALALYEGEIAHWPEALVAVNQALAQDAGISPRR